MKQNKCTKGTFNLCPDSKVWTPIKLNHWAQLFPSCAALEGMAIECFKQCIPNETILVLTRSWETNNAAKGHTTRTSSIAWASLIAGYFLNSRQWEEGTLWNAKELNLPLSKNAPIFGFDAGVKKELVNVARPRPLVLHLVRVLANDC